MDKTAGTSVTLARPALVTNGDVIVVSGTLDLATFTLNRSAPGGEIGVVTGAFLKIGGTNSFPLNYPIHSFNPTNCVAGAAEGAAPLGLEGAGGSVKDSPACACRQRRS